MKSAMQELKDKLKSYALLIKFSQNVDGVLTIIEKDINELLEKEKEQIKDAWDAGMSEGIGTMMADLDWDGEFVNYYKETYGE